VDLLGLATEGEAGVLSSLNADLRRDLSLAAQTLARWMGAGCVSLCRPPPPPLPPTLGLVVCTTPPSMSSTPPPFPHVHSPFG